MYDEVANADSNLESWKSNIEREFKQWISELTTIPEVNPLPEEPDLYSFYQELCVFRNELRVGGRRNQEVLTRFGESLSDFQKTITGLQNRLYQMDKEKEESEFLSRKHLFILLVDVLERMERLKKRLSSPPKKIFFKNDTNWRNAWNSFKDGFDITYSHLDSLLNKEGIMRIETVGMPFDPTCMTAVAVEHTERYPVNQVIEEISPGFLYKGYSIKPAEVRIAKN
ncbi:MAG: nucleotide exchange factor GrpE [Candidatus Jettenia sp. CY-1]|nr:nucleotide exchange factor GrpE [Candidatus Jettenia sp.]WKZ18636.1 MAG: nucleotide exchange factor GrpE [Candidatus Jettenia sp. CY-1]